MADDEAPFRSLYRRFRPQRFAEVRGQDHVVLALSNAVRDDRAGHAYLFSGPRGTGKTSTARILAKALNCESRQGGEPCGVCPSCVSVEKGTSLDVHEMDAASNNGVEAMRDLVARAALGTPGRYKVYIVDEVHMLSTAASNALLKTLEEPPGHVVFVLATTDPQKVLPTIRSRCQPFEFRLLNGDVLSDLLVDVNEAAGLGVAPEAIDLVVRRGKGSARDALSVLDQVAAAGEVDDESPVTDDAVEALCERDAGRVLVAVAAASGAGRDPRRFAADLVDHLRNAFLLTQAPSLVAVPDEVRDRLAEQARRLGPAAMVRGIEILGQAQIDMRDALDARIILEAALVRLARPDTDTSAAAIVERLERLERASVASPAPAASGARAAGGAPAPVAAGVGPHVGATAPPSPAPRGVDPPAAGQPSQDEDRFPVAGRPARQGDTVGAADPPARDEDLFPAAPPARADDRSPAGPAAPQGDDHHGPPPRLPRPERSSAGAGERAPGRTATPPPARPPAPPLPGRRPPAPAAPPSPGAGGADASPPAAQLTAPPRPTAAAPAGGDMPTRDALTKAWGDSIFSSLPGRAKARFGAGRFSAVEGSTAVFVLPNTHYLSRCEEVRPDVEAALAGYFGVPISLRLVVDPPGGRAPFPAAPTGDGIGPADDFSDFGDLQELRDQEPSPEPPRAVTSPEECVKRAFPGAEEVST